MSKFKTGEVRNQMVLFPESVDDYLGEGHLAKIVYSIVSGLNLDKIKNKYSSKGQHAFCPIVLLSILFYGYATGVSSSRKLSKACEERIDFMYLAAKLRPSYKTISEFRRENLEEISELFQEIVVIGIKLGLAKIGNIKISIDGTKMRANASGKLSKDEEGLKELLSNIDKKVAEMMKEAEAVDKKEDLEIGNRRGDEAPKELQKLESRREKIKNAIEELEKEKAELRKEIIEKKRIEGKKEELTKTEANEIEKKKINVTDRDARYMKEREGCIKTNYNAQAAVDEANQFILANDVTKECNDKKQLIPMLEQTEKNIQAKVDACKTDSGYHSGENLSKVSEKELEVFIDDPYKKRVNNKNYKYDKVNFKYDSEKDIYRCPEGKILNLVSKKDGKSSYKCEDCVSCPFKNLCSPKRKHRKIDRNKNEHFIENNREKILSENGYQEYKKRMYTVEPVFGNIKHNLGFRRFLLRGIEMVKGEFDLMCIAHNLKKIASYCTKENISISFAIT